MTEDSTGKQPTPNGGPFARRLPGEVARWQADGLISEEQADAILRRYDTDEGVSAGGAIANRVVSVIAVMGAVLIGLGIIAFIAANWSEIPKFAKLAMMVAGTPAIYIIGWLVGYRFDYPRIGIAIILLGTVAFGASIHLVAQTYHVPVNHPALVPMWFVGVIPLAYISRSRAIMGLSIILFLAAGGFRSQEWAHNSDDFGGVMVTPVFLLLGAFLFSAGRVQARFEFTERFAWMLEIVGLLVVSAAIYMFGFSEVWDTVEHNEPVLSGVSVEYWLVAGVGVVASAAMIAVAGWRRMRSGLGVFWWEAGALAAMAATAAGMWVGLAFGGNWLWWVFNLVMLAGVLAMIAGGYRWNRAYLMNLAVVIFAITLFTRYFEFGFGLLGQSVAFIVAGVILLAGGFGLEFLRRRLVGRMRGAEVAR